MKTELLEKWTVLFGKYKYLLLVILAGVILLLLPTGGGEKPAESGGARETELLDLEIMEKRVCAALKSIYGVGEAEVVLTLKTTMEIVYQSDVRTESSSADGRQGYEHKTVTVSQGSGITQAVVTKHIYPEFKGALIVCDGGGDAGTKLKVIEAVTALTGLSSDKISVARRGSN